MSQEDRKLTKNHLFRQLLQRRVETLEEERSEMKRQISHLERRLTHSTARHAALSGGGMQYVIAQTMEHVQRLRERAEAEADFMQKIALPKQELLFSQMERLRDECSRLHLMMNEMIEGVHAIVEQTQSSGALLIQDATHQQELFISQLDNLYDEHGILRMSIVEARQAAFDVQEQARIERLRLDAKAQAERQRLFAQSEALLYESQKLHGALLSAKEAAHTILYWTQLEAAQAALEIDSAIQSKHIMDSSTCQEESPADEAKALLPFNDQFVLDVAKAAIQEAETLLPHHFSHTSPTSSQRFSSWDSNSTSPTNSVLGLRVMNASNPLLMQRLILSICLCFVVILTVLISL